MLNFESSEFSDAILQLINSSSVLEVRNAFDRFIVYRTPAELLTAAIGFMAARAKFESDQSAGTYSNSMQKPCLCGSLRPASFCCDQGIEAAQSLRSNVILKTDLAESDRNTPAPPKADQGKIRNALLTLFGDLHRELAGYQSKTEWLRTQVSADVIRYANPDVNSDNKTLIVGLSGIAQRLMVPTYRLLRYIDPAQFDLLLLRDRTKQNFLFGIDACESSLDIVGDYVAHMGRASNYKRIISFGTSGGAIPALYLGLRHEFDKVLAVGPASLASKVEMSKLLRELVPRIDEKKRPEIVLSYSSNVPRDAEAVNEIATLIPHAVEAPESRSVTHNTIHDLNMIGLLQWYLERYLLSHVTLGK